jgi:hypothetical protein
MALVADVDDGSPSLVFTKEERARLRRDFPYFCQRLLKINPKIKELVAAREEGDDSKPIGPLIPFIWNEAQREVWRIMCEQIRLGRPLDFAILKARQVGISTFFCAYIFWMMWRQMHTRAAIVAYEKKTTLAELQETIATFYSSLPEGYRPKLRAAGKGGRVGLGDTYFDDRKSRSKYIVQKKGAGRGIASDIVLCTEVSFYDEADEFFGGFVPTMGSGSNSLLVMESSPEDGYFKQKYDEYKADGVYRRAIFIPWWMVTDLYFRNITRKGGKLFDAQSGELVSLTPAIRKKQRLLSRAAEKLGRAALTDEQMWWWMHYCDTKYDGDEEWMAQEFPDDDVTAFQKNSRSAFKVCLDIIHKTCSEVEEIYPDAPGAGTLRSTTYLNPELEQHVWFEPEPKEGWIDQERRPGIFILEGPVPGYVYTVGADVADGEGEDDEEGERAFSTGYVYCCNTRETVAWWRGHIDPTDWGDEIVKIGYFYNEALLTVERNNMGRLTEHRIKIQLRYPIHKIFKWPDWNIGPEAHKGKQTMWETTSTTKPIMIGSLKQWVRDGLFIIRDPMLEYEMSHYRVVKGHFEPVGAFADRIIAASLCVMGVEQSEFKYRNIVLGGAAVKPQSAAGAAGRFLRNAKAITRPTDELPEEFDGMGIARVGDVWDLIGV